MKWFERNSIWIAYGFMAFSILIQMWYINQLKSELKLFEHKEHVVIEVIELEGRKYSDTIRIKCDSSRNKIIKKSISKF